MVGGSGHGGGTMAMFACERQCPKRMARGSAAVVTWPGIRPRQAAGYPAVVTAGAAQEIGMAVHRSSVVAFAAFAVLAPLAGAAGTMSAAASSPEKFPGVSAPNARIVVVFDRVSGAPARAKGVGKFTNPSPGIYCVKAAKATKITDVRKTAPMVSLIPRRRSTRWRRRLSAATTARR